MKKQIDSTSLPKEIQPKRKEMIGQVISTKMQKTVIVAVTHTTRHPLYNKAMRRTKHFSAHNESLDITKGDRVRIVETKPMSRTKHFLVIDKII